MRVSATMTGIACIALLSGQACAAESTWTIDIRGIERHEYRYSDPPRHSFEMIDGSGYFTGFDSNRDGVLTKSEISRVNVLLFSWPDGFDSVPPEFSYSDSGGLHINGAVFKDRMVLDFGRSLILGIEGWSEEYPDGRLELLWTPETITRIEGPSLAVPEPETYSLLLAGLGLVCYAARRKSALNPR